jgi:hypothetical protein
MNNTLIEFYDENPHPQLTYLIESIVDRKLLFRASSLETAQLSSGSPADSKFIW